MEKIEIKEESIAEDNTSEMIDNDNSDDLDISQTKNQNSQKNKVVEKVLQMRYRRVRLHFLFALKFQII